MAIALRHAQLQRSGGCFECALALSGRGVGVRQIVQYGNAARPVVQHLGERQTPLEVRLCGVELSLIRREDAQDVVRLQ